MSDAVSIIDIKVNEATREVTVSLKYESFVIALSDYEGADIKAGDIVDELLYDRLTFLSEKLACMKKAVRALSYAPKSEFMLKLKLRESYSDDVIEPVLEKLRELRYTDDDGLALRYAEKLACKSCFGPLRIRAKLRTYGFAVNCIDDAMAAVDDAAYLDGMSRRIKKRFGEISRPDEHTRRMITDYLLRYGFINEQINEYISEL